MRPLVKYYNISDAKLGLRTYVVSVSAGQSKHPCRSDGFMVNDCLFLQIANNIVLTPDGPNE